MQTKNENMNDLPFIPDVSPEIAKLESAPSQPSKLSFVAYDENEEIAPFDIVSSRIVELLKQLNSAKLEFAPILKTATNPHFKNKYATLDNIVASVQPALLKYGLHPTSVSVRVDGVYHLRTVIMHEETQQYIGTQLPYEPDLKNPQKIASCLTYLQRYNLATLLCLVIEQDDDGNTASGINKMVQRCSKEQADAINGILNSVGIKDKTDKQEIIEWLQKKGVSKILELPTDYYEELEQFTKSVALSHLIRSLKLDINEDVKPLFKEMGYTVTKDVPSDKYEEVKTKFQELHDKRYGKSE